MQVNATQENIDDMDGREAQNMEDVESIGSTPAETYVLPERGAGEAETSYGPQEATTASSRYRPLLRPRSISPSQYGSSKLGFPLLRLRVPLKKSTKVSAAIGS